MLVLSSMLTNREKLINLKQEIVNGIKPLQTENPILTEGRKVTKNDIKKRVEIFYNYFNRFILC